MPLVPPIRLALAGLGRITEYQLAALAALPAFQLVATCDPDVTRAAVGPPGAAYFPALEMMLDSVACDAVLVSTPTPTHFAVAQQVLQAGRHLLVEKPAVTQTDQLEELLEMAQQTGLLLQTALHMARGAETDWALTQLSDLGPLTHFACHFHDPLCVDGQLDPRAPSVLGSWLDSGINALSVVARFVDMPALAVTRASFVEEPRFPVQDIGSRVEFQGEGVSGLVVTDWTQPSRQKTTTLRFTNGQEIVLDHSAETATLSGAAPRHCQRQPVRLVDHYIGVFTDFALALTTGLSNAQRSLHLHQLLLDARR